MKNIYLLGDIGHLNEHTKSIIKTIKEETYENKSLLLVLGDNFYPFGINSIYDSRVKDLGRILDINCEVCPILGNHDYLGNPFDQLSLPIKNWNFENFFYKKSIYNFEFFFIDTVILQPNYSSTNINLMKSKIQNFEETRSNMLKWLESELLNSNKIKIVVGHYPIISLGVYGFNQELFEILINIFEKANVRLYISGHDHNLQISKVSNYESNYDFTHIVSGSGSDVYERISFPDIENNNILHINGYVKLSIEENSEEMNIEFCNEIGEVIRKEVLD